LFLTQRRFKIDDRLQKSARGRSWLAELQVATLCVNASEHSKLHFHFSFCSGGAAASIELSGVAAHL